MIIGVDIDGCAVDVLSHWNTYLIGRYSMKPAYLGGKKKPYDLSEAFDIPSDCDPFTFWRDANLYEGLKPIQGSITTLRALKDEGHEIVFVSQGKGFHFRNKYYFIDKWFPFKDAVILTKEKHYARVDVMVDDTYRVLDNMPDNVLTIKFKDDTIQLPPNKKHLFANSWEDVYKLIKENEKGE